MSEPQWFCARTVSSVRPIALGRVLQIQTDEGNQRKMRSQDQNQGPKEQGHIIAQHAKLPILFFITLQLTRIGLSALAKSAVQIVVLAPHAGEGGDIRGKRKAPGVIRVIIIIEALRASAVLGHRATGPTGGEQDPIRPDEPSQAAVLRLRRHVCQVQPSTVQGTKQGFAGRCRDAVHHKSLVWNSTGRPFQPHR